MAIIVIALSVWGYKFLRGRNLLKPTNNFYVSYENINGLASSAPVLIRGMNVGTVSNLELADDLKTIVATLDIKRGIRIHKDAEAVIISTGLMGGKAVDLQIPGPCSGADCAESGSFITGRVQGFLDSFLDTSEGGTLDQIKTNIGEILNTFGDSLTSPTSDSEIAKTYTQLSILIKNLASITNTLDNSMGTYDKHLKGTLANVEKMTGAFAKNEQQIGDAIKHLESITRQFDEAKVGTSTSALITDAQATMKNLNTSLTEANKSFADLATVMDGLEQGKGSLGKLLKDDALYNNLSSTSKNLDLLLQDFRLNPKRYVNVSVFGKKQKEYEVPENDPAKE